MSGELLKLVHRVLHNSFHSSVLKTRMKHVFQSIELKSHNRSSSASSNSPGRLSSHNKPLLSIYLVRTNKNRAQLPSAMGITISCPHFHLSTPIYPQTQLLHSAQSILFFPTISSTDPSISSMSPLPQNLHHDQPSSNV